MPRALAILETAVSPAERDAFRARSRIAKEYYAMRDCRYWLFEDEARSGKYVEFIEAGDDNVLREARSGAPGRRNETPLFLEVELS